MITEVINNFYLNIDSNSNTINTDNIHVMRLDWFDNDHREKLKNNEKYDTVIIADVIYTTSVVDELIETIKATRANDIFVCMPKARQGASDFNKYNDNKVLDLFNNVLNIISILN